MELPGPFTAGQIVGGVQRDATPRYLFADLARAEAFAAFEEHVFDPVRGTGAARQLGHALVSHF